MLLRSLTEEELVDSSSMLEQQPQEEEQRHYGSPLTAEDASNKMQPGDAGLVWFAIVVPDTLLHGLQPNDLDVDTHTIKPRRPSLPLTTTDLLSSLTQLIDGRWIFHGKLNAWPGLTTLELIALEQKRPQGTMASPKAVLTGQLVWMQHWSTATGAALPVLEKHRVYRATLRGPPWSAVGWSRDSPGFVYWCEPHKDRLTYGTNMVSTLSRDDTCTMVHMISHRYAVKRESPRDKLTYHTIVLLEWNHGQYCTVVEGAYLNGISGYRGRSNWYHDRDEPVSSLYKAFPPEMIGPWLTTWAEIRCFDVDAKNLDEFKAFVYQYEGSDKRFIDPHFHFSHKARLTFRSKSNIASYLLNYIGRDCTYSDLSKNCQTLAADLCGLLAGKKGIVPFHPVSRIEYRDSKHLFLYDSHLYERKSAKGSIY